MTHHFVVAIIPRMEMTIGTRLCEFAKRTKGWSAEQFAEKLGVSYETVRKWVKGSTEPNRNRIKTIMLVLDVTEQWIRHGGEDAAAAKGLGTAEALEHLSNLMLSLPELQRVMSKSALQVFIDDPGTWKEVAVQLQALIDQPPGMGGASNNAAGSAKTRRGSIYQDGQHVKNPVSRNNIKKEAIR